MTIPPDPAAAPLMPGQVHVHHVEHPAQQPRECTGVAASWCPVHGHWPPHMDDVRVHLAALEGPRW